MGLGEDIKRSILDFHHGGAAFCFSGLRRRIGRDRRMTVPLPKRGGSATIRTRDSDFAILRQVFISRDYALDHVGASAQVVRDRYDEILAAGGVPVIVDAGANIGAASIWFKTQFPKATVVAIEPDPGNVEILRRNVAPLGGVIVLAAAIGSAPGFVALSSAGGSSGIQSARDESGFPIVTMAQAIAAVPDGALLIAKIDIEGFESDLFAANTEWIDEATLLYIEPHDWMLPGRGTSRNFQAELGKRDFEIHPKGENLIYTRRKSR